MKTYLLPLALAALLAGCVIVAESDANPRPRPAPPSAPPSDPPPAYDPPGRVVSAESMRKYEAKVPDVFEAAKKTLRSWRYQITGDFTPGDDNWTLNGARGDDRLHIALNRKNHKTRTTVRFTLTGSVTDSDAKKMAREFHDGLGRNLGESGSD